MKDMNPTKHPGQNPHPDDLDHLLDSALAKYAAVELRMGLEERVMAHLQADAQQPSRRSWLQWGLSTAFAAIVVVAALAWRSSRIPHPLVANHPPAITQGPSLEEANSRPRSVEGAPIAKHPSMRTRATRRAHSSTEATHPMLDQFPSPQPLSTEEIALAMYVKNFPKEAQLVAQAQEEFALETEKVMKDRKSVV